MKTFCYKCSLRTGSLIVGYFYAVVSAFGFLTFASFGASYSPTSDLLSMFAFIFLKFLGINVVLLVGVYKEKPAFILPWLAWTTVCIVIQGVIVSLLSMAAHHSIDAGARIAISLALLCFFALQMYFILVISTFYHNIKRPSHADEEALPM